MGKKVILLFVCMLLSVMTISGATPFQVGSGETGFDIRTPQTNTVKQNQEIDYHVHIYNKSSGLLITNATTNCYLHLYNSTGNHVLERELEFDSNAQEFKLDIMGGNFSTIQSMSGITWCNSSTEGGFVSFGFEVTPNGLNLSDAQSKLYVPLFFIFFFLFFVIFYSISLLPGENEKDPEERIIKISFLKYFRSTLYFVLYLLIVVMLFISSNLALTYLLDGLISSFLFAFFQISFMLILPIVIIWFLWILAKITEDKQLNNMMKRGMFQQNL